MDKIIPQLNLVESLKRQKECSTHADTLKELERAMPQDYRYFSKIANDSPSMQTQGTKWIYNHSSETQLVINRAQRSIIQYCQPYITNCMSLIDTLMATNNDRIVARSSTANILNQEQEKKN